MASEILRQIEETLPGLPEGSEKFALERTGILIRGGIPLAEAATLAQKMIAAREMAERGLGSIERELLSKPELSLIERKADIVAAAAGNLSLLEQIHPFIEPLLKLRPDVKVTWKQPHWGLRDRYFLLTDGGLTYQTETWFRGWRMRRVTPRLLAELSKNELDRFQVNNFATQGGIDIVIKLRRAFPLSKRGRPNQARSV